MAMTGDKHQTPEVVVQTQSGPMRMCVGCRARCAQSRLLRFGLRPGVGQQPAQVAPTLSALGGRSAYLCPRRECLERAIKRRVFTRAFTGTSGKPSSRSGRAGRAGRGSSSGDSNNSSESGSIESVRAAAADTLWTATTDILRREIDLLGRCAEKSHAHLRRRGLERLLFELSSQPAPSDGRSSTNRQGGTPTHG